MSEPRIVGDMSVAGLRSQLGASSRILTLIAGRRLVPLVTTALFLEHEDALRRPEQRLATGMAKEDIVGFLAAVTSAAEPVQADRAPRRSTHDKASHIGYDGLSGHFLSLTTLKRAVKRIAKSAWFVSGSGRRMGDRLDADHI